MGLEAALAWKTCTFDLTKKLPCLDIIYKKLSNYTAILQMNRDNNGNSIDLILVGKCPLSVKRRNNTLLMVSTQAVTQFVVYTSQ